MGLDGESLRWLKRGALLAILLLLVALVIAIPRLGEAQEGDPGLPFPLTPPPPQLGTPEGQFVETGEGLVASSSGNAYFVPPSEFMVIGGPMDAKVFGYIAPDGASECLLAPVYLPDGVNISKFTMWAFDNYNAGYVFAYLIRTAYKTTAGPALFTFVQTDFSGTSGSMQVISVPVADTIPVTNSDYFYHIYACVYGTNDSQTRFYGAQVEYTE